MFGDVKSDTLRQAQYKTFTGFIQFPQWECEPNCSYTIYVQPSVTCKPFKFVTNVKYRGLIEVKDILIGNYSLFLSSKSRVIDQENANIFSYDYLSIDANLLNRLTFESPMVMTPAIQMTFSFKYTGKKPFVLNACAKAIVVREWSQD